VLFLPIIFSIAVGLMSRLLGVGLPAEEGSTSMLFPDYFSFSCIIFINCICSCACCGCCSGVAELSVLVGYEPEYWSYLSGFKCVIVLTFESETTTMY
jgi:hypothetical protein